MKRLTTHRLMICPFLFTLLFMLSSCSRAEVPATAKEEQVIEGDTLKDKKVLIMYLSRTKNTKAVAEIIHSKVGGDLVA